MARSPADTRQVVLHDHAYSVRADCCARHIPGIGNPARRTTRIQRSRSNGSAGRRRRGLHQDVQAGAGRRSRQSCRFRSGAQCGGNRRNPGCRKRCAIRARLRSDTRQASVGRLVCRNNPQSTVMPGLTLNEDSVFVITGAAGSIVSAITADLATASGGTFYLLDLVPEPDPE